MKRLFLIAFREHKYRFRIFVTLIAMLLLTVASQLEVLTLGVITKKGPDFFELFAPIDKGFLKKTDVITHKELESRFHLIDVQNKGEITTDQATLFLSQWREKDLIASVMDWVNSYFDITGNLVNLSLMVVLVALFKAITLFKQLEAMQILFNSQEAHFGIFIEDIYQKFFDLMFEYYEKMTTQIGGALVKLKSDNLLYLL